MVLPGRNHIKIKIIVYIKGFDFIFVVSFP